MHDLVIIFTVLFGTLVLGMTLAMLAGVIACVVQGEVK